MQNINIELLDIAALLWFLTCWFSYARMEHTRPGLSKDVEKWREGWATAMLNRDNRMVDIQAINAMISNVTFFASTTILILAGLFAMLGAVEKGIEVFENMPFLQTMTPASWVLKAGTLVVIFIYAFFKFGWSIKQHTISAVVMAATPEPKHCNTDEARTNALRMARLGNLGAKHYQDGIRAYYFALAALSWYIHAWVFMLATVWVVAVLFRREYRSRAHDFLTGDLS
uniref:DUF599 domain-containing protein n=1 Tax=uncultured Thiotrichaceae bacterium TaxID=298394 RepID=A0A6S6SBI4_9GAMM|nr:MAG: DUF599 domain-containing protein [uncultured Thiotrichaceae bacterium]